MPLTIPFPMAIACAGLSYILIGVSFLLGLLYPNPIYRPSGGRVSTRVLGSIICVALGALLLLEDWRLIARESPASWPPQALIALGGGAAALLGLAVFGFSLVSLMRRRAAYRQARAESRRAREEHAHG